MARLPVLFLVRETYREAWSRRRDAALPLLVLLFAYAIYFPLYYRRTLTSAAAPSDTLFNISWGLIPIIVLNLSLMVGLSRSVLLREPHAGWSLFRFDRGLWRAVLAAVKLSSVLAIYSLPPAMAIIGATIPLLLASLFSGSISTALAVMVLLFMVLGLVQFFVLQRHMLALPAAAMGDDSRLYTAWRRTRGNSLRLMLVVGLVALPFVTVFVLLSGYQVLYQLLGQLTQSTVKLDLHYWISIAAGFFLQAVFTVLGAVMLAVIYRQFRHMEGDTVMLRLGWQRVPVFFSILIGTSLWFLGLLLVAWLGVVAFNLFDSPPDPETRTWLATVQRPALDPHQNGYMQLVGLQSTAADPALAAQRWLDAERKMIQESRQAYSPPSAADYLALQHQLLPQGPDFPAILPKCSPVPACAYDYDVILAQRGDAERQINAEQPALARLEAIYAMPHFQEDYVAGKNTPGLNAYYLFADHAYRLRMVYELEDGHAEQAYRRWQLRQQFFVREAENAESLERFRDATMSLERGQLYLVNMVLHHPETSELASKLALPLLDKGEASRLGSRLGRVIIVSNFVFDQDVFSRMTLPAMWHNYFHPQSDNKPTSILNLMVPPLQHYGTLNLTLKVLMNNLASARIPLDGKLPKIDAATQKMCSKSGLAPIFTIDNPLGRLLACVTDDDLRPMKRGMDQFIAANEATYEALSSGGNRAMLLAAQKRLELAL